MFKLGRVPTLDELAAELSVPESDLTAVALATCNLSVSDAANGNLFEPKDETTGPEDELAKRQSSALVSSRVRAALAGLAERDRMVIDTQLEEDACSMAELGTSLGITRQRVSQIASRVRKQLGRELGDLSCGARRNPVAVPAARPDPAGARERAP